MQLFLTQAGRRYYTSSEQLSSSFLLQNPRLLNRTAEGLSPQEQAVAQQVHQDPDFAFCPFC